MFNFHVLAQVYLALLFLLLLSPIVGTPESVLELYVQEHFQIDKL